MEIVIKQKKISFKDKYEIFTDGAQTHLAKSKLLRFFSEIDLLKSATETVELTVMRRFALFKARYDIIFPNQTLVEFHTESIWKLHYRCTDGGDVYDIYGHKGRKYSVFKNEQQVAWWDKNAVTFFKGDDYKIIADGNANHELIMAFCLIIDNYRTNKSDDKAIKFDFNLGFNKRKFDNNWFPKS